MMNNLKEDGVSSSDPIDRASAELEAASVSLIQQRHYNLISKIDCALKRIQNDNYGYCQETGEEIGLKRLEALPTATFCVETQERHEKQDKNFDR
jgi:DnaK suppressor protein